MLPILLTQSFACAGIPDLEPLGAVCVSAPLDANARERLQVILSRVAEVCPEATHVLNAHFEYVPDYCRMTGDAYRKSGAAVVTGADVDDFVNRRLAPLPRWLRDALATYLGVLARRDGYPDAIRRLSELLDYLEQPALASKHIGPVGVPMQRSVTVERLIKLASDLKSEHGENREYDRALVELVTDAAGLPMEFCHLLAGAIGVKPASI